MKSVLVLLIFIFISATCGAQTLTQEQEKIKEAQENLYLEFQHFKKTYKNFKNSDGKILNWISKSKTSITIGRSDQAETRSVELILWPKILIFEKVESNRGKAFYRDIESLEQWKLVTEFLREDLNSLKGQYDKSFASK